MRPKQTIQFRLLPLGLPLLLALVVVTGCTVGPDYRPPDMSSVMQQNWQAAGGKPFAQGPPLVSWWRQFDDEQLTGLVRRLTSSSLALEEARQRVAEVNARYGVIGADRQLQLAAALGYTHAETGDETFSLQGLPPGEVLNVYSAGLTAGWELDLWGKTARRLEAAEADIGAGYADLQSMQVSLAAEMALAYVDARTLEARLDTIGKNIELQQETLKLAQSRYEAGNGTALSVVRTQRLLESTRARVPELERALAVTKNHIKVLLGLPPREAVLQPGPMPAVPEMMGLGLPADLLTRRPDIRQAFHRFHAAVARIGAAEAERYPALSLSGTLTLSSDALDGLLDTDTLMYSLGPGIHIPILTGHRIESTIAVRSAQAEQARLAIEQKIVAALTEVENAAQGVVRSQQRANRLAGAEKLALKSVELSDSLYRSGLVDFSEVLDNEQELVALQESLLLAKQQALSEVIRLYRALGGGWEQTEDNYKNDGDPL
jgi:NodT family efflux transporter outer membrane factor (OMF) lipoprotein